MKRRKRVPEFKTDKEAAEFWDTHSLEDFDLEEVHDLRFAPPRKRVVALRLDSPTLRRVKAIASRKGVAYTSLIRMWVIQNCRKQAKAKLKSTVELVREAFLRRGTTPLVMGGQPVKPVKAKRPAKPSGNGARK